MAANVTIIGRATRVRGRITGPADLEVQGFVEGDIAVGGDVTIDVAGMVGAGVQGQKIVVRGAVKGDLVGSEAVLLEDGARVDRPRRTRARLRANWPTGSTACATSAGRRRRLEACHPEPGPGCRAREDGCSADRSGRSCHRRVYQGRGRGYAAPASSADRAGAEEGERADREEKG